MAAEYQTGQVINQRFWVYQVRHGGVGIVYLCVDFANGQLLALKTLQEKYLQDSSYLNVFRQEPLIWIRLGKHPNIVRFVDWAIIDNQPYIALECIVGDTKTTNLFSANKQDPVINLSEWLANGALTLRQSLDFAVDICRGMAHANSIGSAGIVHRDLKPENILIGAGEIAKITDFGLAREVSDQANSQLNLKSNMESGRGTPYYMAPEQWEDSKLDARCDIYATGCIIYEMLTGHKYIMGNSLSEVRERHSTAPYNPIGNIPDSLNDIIKRCLAKSPSDRYKSFEELLEVLTDVYQSCFESPPRQLTLDNHDTAEDFIARAGAYYRLGKFSSAIEDLTHGLDFYPNNHQMLAFRALFRSDIAQHQAAFQDMEQALALNPASAEYYYMQALILLQAARYDDAIASLDKAQNLGYAKTEILFRRAFAKGMLGRFEESVGEFTQAINLYPKDIPVNSIIYLLRGRVYYATGKIELALADFDRRVRLATDDIEAYLERGALYLAQGDYTSALKDFTRAKQVLPQNPIGWFWNGKALKAAKFYAEALNEFNAAYDLGLKTVLLLLERGDLYISMSLAEYAVEDINAIAAMIPNNPYALEMRARAYTQMQRYTEAEADFTDAIAYVPNMAAAYLGRARLMFVLKRYANALQDLQECLKYDPKNPTVYFTLGLTLAALERFAEATLFYTHAIQQKPDYAFAFTYRGHVQLGQDRLPQAKMDYQIALKHDPSMYDAWSGLGLATEMSGQVPQALQFYDRAAKLGAPSGVERGNAIRKRFGMPLLPDPLEVIYKMVQDAPNLASMRRVVENFPYMQYPDFNLFLRKLGTSEDEKRWILSDEKLFQLRVAVSERLRIM